MYCKLCKYGHGIYRIFMKLFMRKGCKYKCPYQKEQKEGDKK